MGRVQANSLNLSISCGRRNQAYETRIHLAILDHNGHNQREKAKNTSGDLVYQRKYQKQSKKWDVTNVLEPK